MPLTSLSEIDGLDAIWKGFEKQQKINVRSCAVDQANRVFGNAGADIFGGQRVGVAVD